jgi:hypothetical protein
MEERGEPLPRQAGEHPSDFFLFSRLKVNLRRDEPGGILDSASPRNTRAHRPSADFDRHDQLAKDLLALDQK